MKRLLLLLLLLLLVFIFASCDGSGNDGGSDSGTDLSGTDTTVDTDSNSFSDSASKPGTDSGDTETSDGSIQWIVLAGGSFWMGNEGSLSSSPLIEVSLESFEMMKTEATTAQYKECYNDGNCSIPYQESNCDPGPDNADYANWNIEGREQHPINCINWQQAVDFCTWAGGRLPTEAEWEYAAGNSGKGDTYPWGNSEPICDNVVATLDQLECNPGHTAPVCSKPSGNSEQEICDLVGNVSEWMADWYILGYDEYPRDGSPAPLDIVDERSHRGASHVDGLESLNVLTIFARGKIEPDRAIPFIGVRCVR